MNTKRSIFVATVLLLNLGIALNLALAQDGGTKERGPELFTNTYVVPPNFFVEVGPESRQRKLSAKEIFESAGISFGPGSSVVFSVATSALVVKNTRSQLKRVDDFIGKFLANGRMEMQIYLTVRFVESDISLVSTRLGISSDKPPTITGDIDFNSFVSTVAWESDMLNVLGADDMKALTREGADPRIVPVSGITQIYTNPQFQLMIKDLSQKESAEIFAAPSGMIRSGRQVLFQHDDRGVGVKVDIGANGFTLDMSIFSREEADGKGGGRKISRQKVTIFDGHAIALEQKLPDGRYRIEFITAQIMDPTGLPIHGHIVDEEKKAPEAPKEKLSLNPGDLTSQQKIAITEADEFALKGSQLMVEDNFDEAQENYQRALQLLPDKEIAKQREKAYVKQFLRALRSGREKSK